jgi:hypothetical protein
MLSCYVVGKMIFIWCSLAVLDSAALEYSEKENSTSTIMSIFHPLLPVIVLTIPFGTSYIYIYIYI